MKTYIDLLQLLINSLTLRMRETSGNPQKYHSALNKLEEAQILLEQIENE